MYRTEIIANQSVQEDIIEVLEEKIPDILYTLIPLVHGRGKNDRKLGSATWPESNFLLVAYSSKENAKKIEAVIAAVKERFPDEGIKVFFVKAKNTLIKK